MKKFLIPILILFSGNVFAENYAWDALRPVTDIAKEVDLPVKIIVFLLALSIFVISFLAYQKSKSKRILLVTIAFALFSLKWFVKLIDLFYSPGNFLTDSSENIFELGIMVSLLVALFYNKSWKRVLSKK